MRTPEPAPLDPAPPVSLAALAAQLRDGPLQQLVLLERQANELAARLAECPGDRVEDAERLVRLALGAMDQFHAFTRNVAAVLVELSDARRRSH